MDGNKDKWIENIDPYEREKVELTIGDLEMAAATLRNYLALADELGSKGIAVNTSKFNFDKLRQEFAGIKGPLNKLLNDAEKAAFHIQDEAVRNGVNVRELQANITGRVVEDRIGTIVKDNKVNHLKGPTRQALKRVIDSL